MEFLVEQLKTAIEEKSEYKLKWKTLENHNTKFYDIIYKIANIHDFCIILGYIKATMG